MYVVTVSGCAEECIFGTCVPRARRLYIAVRFAARAAFPGDSLSAGKTADRIISLKSAYFPPAADSALAGKGGSPGLEDGRGGMRIQRPFCAGGSIAPNAGEGEKRCAVVARSGG